MSRALGRSIFILAVTILGCACQSSLATRTLPVYGDSTMTPYWGSDAKRASRHRIGQWSLTDQRGESITEESLSGSIYVASFIFTTCPTICPTIVETLMRVQESYGSDPRVRLVSYSVLPDHDTVEVLRQYADEKGILDGKWLLLTGNREEIYRLARESFFADALPAGSDDFLHTEKVFLVDEQRRLRGVYNGTQRSDIVSLISDIARLEGKAPPWKRVGAS